MTKPDLTETELDAIFAAARRDVPEPRLDFLAALEADAVAAVVPHNGPTPRSSWFAQLRDALGGWAGLGGLATATVAGIWIGVSPPSLLPDPLTVVTGLDGSIATMDGWLTSDADTWQEFDDG